MRKCVSNGRFRYVFLGICISVGLYVQFMPLKIKQNIIRQYTKIKYILPKAIMVQMNMDLPDDDAEDEDDNSPENTGRLMIITSYHTRSMYLGPNTTITRLQLTSDRCSMFTSKDLETLVIKAIQNDYQHIYINSNIEEQSFQYLNRFEFRTEMSILRYKGNSTVPFERHFTSVTDDKTINSTIESASYELGLWKTSLIQKVLYISEIHTSGKVDIKAPPIALARETMATFLMEDVLIHYDAFWSIIFFDHNIWSSWVQRLLQELDSWVAFISVKPSSSDCDIDKNLHSKISKQLSNWKCNNRTDFFSCVKSLNEFMFSNQITSIQNVKKINNWLDTLIQNGYKPPELVKAERKSQHVVHKVLYMPKVNDVKQDLDGSFQTVCNRTLGSCPIMTHSFKRSSSFLLVLVFNNGIHYEQVKYLAKVYLPAFSHILICGTDMVNYYPVFIEMESKLSFVEMPALFSRGERAYLCLEAAIKMNYHNIDGYLHLGDDVLLNIWNLPKIPKNKIWFHKSIRPANITQKTVPDIWKAKTWWPWNNRAGQPALNAIIKYFQKVSKDNPLIKSFLDRLVHNSGGVDKGFYEVSDIYYVPRHLRFLYAQFARLFLQHGVYHEIAVPTILMGLIDIKDLVRLEGTYLWYDERKLYSQFYNETHVFFHPIKEAPCFADKICTEFKCNRYFPCLNMKGSV